MKRRQGWLFFIIVLLSLSVYLVINYPLKLGLDLKGGTQFTLQLVKEEGKVTNEDLSAVKAVLDRRVNNLGVAESNLQTVGRDQLILELPGKTNDAEEASKVLGKTALLEFRTQKTGTLEEFKSLRDQRSIINLLIEQLLVSEKRKNEDNSFADINKNLKIIEESINYSSNSNELFEKLIDTKKYINKEITDLFSKTDLTGKDLVNVAIKPEQTNNNWEVLLTFNRDGGVKFENITKSIAGTNKLLAIILDGESISEASVGNQFSNTGITGGTASISGNISLENARELEVQLKGGSLPLPIEIVETNGIGALLGTENIIKSLYAAIIGLILVGLFMIFNYRILGLVSLISLIFYGFFNLAIYSLIDVTLTLPGISGLILSIGMAVDANILIFERIREELTEGNTLIKSIDSGFLRANSSIIDGHITTFVSCFVLFLLGTNFVKGFALTLGIGVVVSLFTSLSCSKTTLKFLTTYQSFRQKNLYMSNESFLN